MNREIESIFTLVLLAFLVGVPSVQLIVFILIELNGKARALVVFGSVFAILAAWITDGWDAMGTIIVLIGILAIIFLLLSAIIRMLRGLE